MLSRHIAELAGNAIRGVSRQQGWPAWLFATLLRLGDRCFRAKHFKGAAGFFRLAKLCDRESTLAERYLLHCVRASGGRVRRLDYVILGTTGLCNASCIHCPTGKAATAHVPRTPMAMELFERIIRQLAEADTMINAHLAFGLFGDGLVDPFVVERARIVRRYLPDVRLVINTNGAAFNAARHGPLAELVDAVNLHCESLVEENYDRLMAPLRLRNVRPRFDQLLETFAEVHVSVPVSRINHPELEDIAVWFEQRGAAMVHFDPLASRCAEDTTVFDALSLNPQPIACGPQVLDSLIIDSDGTVLSCCQDFQRLNPLGDMLADSLDRALSDERRLATREQLAQGRHAEIVTCGRCRGDIRTENFPFDIAV